MEVPQVHILVSGDHDDLGEGVCFPNFNGSVLSAHSEEETVGGKAHGFDGLRLEVSKTVAEDVNLERFGVGLNFIHALFASILLWGRLESKL